MEKAIVTVIGESTPDGGLREYVLIPEYAENPEIPVAPSCAYPEEESSNNASPEETEYVLSAEKPTFDEAVWPSNTVEEQTPRILAAVPPEDSEEEVVPMARTVAQRRLKRKRALSPESDWPPRLVSSHLISSRLASLCSAVSLFGFSFGQPFGAA